MEDNYTFGGSPGGGNIGAMGGHTNKGMTSLPKGYHERAKQLAKAKLLSEDNYSLNDKAHNAKLFISNNPEVAGGLAVGGYNAIKGTVKQVKRFSRDMPLNKEISYLKEGLRGQMKTPKQKAAYKRIIKDINEDYAIHTISSTISKYKVDLTPQQIKDFNRILALVSQKRSNKRKFGTVGNAAIETASGFVKGAVLGKAARIIKNMNK